MLIQGGRLWDTGDVGYMLSRSSASKRFSGEITPSVYFLTFDTGGVNPSDGPGNRWVGRPLRYQLLHFIRFPKQFPSGNSNYDDLNTYSPGNEKHPIEPGVFHILSSL
jgi:hypothetical protein